MEEYYEYQNNPKLKDNSLSTYILKIEDLPISLEDKKNLYAAVDLIKIIGQDQGTSCRQYIFDPSKLDMTYAKYNLNEYISAINYVKSYSTQSYTGFIEDFIKKLKIF